MNTYVLGFHEIDKTKLMLAGGKGANLGELSTIEGIRVPDGFCVTTEAYKKITGNNKKFDALLDELNHLMPGDRKKISEISTAIRALIESIPVSNDIEEEIDSYLEKNGAHDAYAIRSSATAEDLPSASFAGQQDTYLNITGKKNILTHISKCWASLFTERAVTYRIQNGFDHHKVYLSVVIQKMIFPDAAGILFTADPVTSNRKILSIDAGFGLGEALVSGIVNADVYKVRNSEIIDKKIAAKKVAIHALKEGGTKEQPIEAAQQNKQALTDEQVLQLEHTGRKIEAHFHSPQDIEWCLVNDNFYIVQSRPITTLFPIPKENDNENHVYLSTGHQQMMTDPIKPLGISFWQLLAARPMSVAGGRFFVDVAGMLAAPATRNMLLNMMAKSDPLTKDAITTILERGDFIKTLPGHDAGKSKTPPPPNFAALVDIDPAVVDDLVRKFERSVEELKQSIQSRSGSAVFDYIRENTQHLKKILSDPKSIEVIMTVMNAAAWINEKMNEWLGEKNVADALTQSVSNNITSEMGLALLDVADVIRPYPEVIGYLQQTKDDNFLSELSKLKGGKETRDAIGNYLEKYGMRCVGEIDITKTRWSEKPLMLVPLLLSNFKNFEAGAGKRKFEEGWQQALNKKQDLLEQLKRLPDSEEKIKETKRMIDLVRNFAGYREYPKYFWISHYLFYKKAVLKEAARLAEKNIIHEKEDIYYLTFDELQEAVRTGTLDHNIIDTRKEEYRLYEKLTPPRVLTSDGEALTGSYKRENMPAGAIIGLPVSSGIIEGRARVILDMEDASPEEGDILVTAFTDPSWTPLFVSIKGLVTEVGGLMTHGAVIAREYGLPAVVSVENATKLIRDGQRIRVNGTDGYIEIV